MLLTVPAFTLSYPYLFLRGNTPAVPVLEPVVRFVHFRVLEGKFASFGYERSFLRRTVAELLAMPGLEQTEVGRFDTYLPLLTLPSRLRAFARRLARTDAFAPMYYGVATRSISSLD